jgi:imidazolonepropionase-like amidohydrolase
MVKSGLTPMQAIVAATATAARAVNSADQIGTLETGKWADFLVLDGILRTRASWSRYGSPAIVCRRR